MSPHAPEPETCRECSREYAPEDLSPSGYCEDCHPYIRGPRLERGIGQPRSRLRRTGNQDMTIDPGRARLRAMLADYRARKNNPAKDKNA